MVLEELEHAKARGARIYGEITGFGMSGDAHHITAPPADGEGAARCMKIAIADAGLNPEQLDYINAHGTSTGLGDRAESDAIKTAFGDHAYQVTVSSTKSMTGHLLGAAGGVESIFCIRALETGRIPPTLNLEDPDPECRLDHVVDKAREGPLRVVLNNSFGFGGTNAALVLRAWDDG